MASSTTERGSQRVVQQQANEQPAPLAPFSAQSGSPGQLPNLLDAEVIASEGLESYYTALGAWRYLRQEALQQAENDYQRLVINALYSESFDPSSRWLTPEQLTAQVAALLQAPTELDDQRLAQARERLLDLRVIKELTFGDSKQLALNFPARNQLNPPWPLGYQRRRLLLEKYGIENSYLAIGQAAAIYYQALNRAENQQQRLLIERLSEEILPDGLGPRGLSVAELTCQSPLSMAEEQRLQADLQRLVELVALRQVDVSGQRHYALPAVRVELLTAEYSGPDFTPAWQHAVAKHGPEYLWRFLGRIEHRRRQLLAIAESDVERAVVQRLAELQADHPRAGGFKRSYLVEQVCKDLGIADGDGVYQVIDNSPVGQQLSSSWAANGIQFLALVSDDYRWQSQAEFVSNASAAERGRALFAAGTPERYYRALGRGIAINQELVESLRGAVSDREVKKIQARFAPGLLNPERRWVAAEEVYQLIEADGGQSVAEKITAIQRQLLDSGVLLSRPDPQGADGRAERQYALAADPWEEISNHARDG